MPDYPLAVAIAALLNENKILLIKRMKGDCIGLWGLPGGKIEKDEHVSEAVVREILEETGIESDFKAYLGFVSEHLVENNKIKAHFLLHVCELVANEFPEIENKNLGWFELNEIEAMKDEIIPSDFLMIEKLVRNREGNYYNCVIEKTGDSHVLRKFE
jgi:mutator protein MutT